MSDVRKALKRFVRDNQRGLRFYVAKVVAIDEENKTCDIDPLDDGPTIFDVRLKPELGGNTGVYAIPKKGSYVFAAELGDENNVCLLAVEKASKYVVMTDGGTIELNGSDFGMLKAKNLIDEINKLKAAVLQIKSAISGAAVFAGDGGAVFKTNIIAALANLDAGNFNNLINDKVKHG